MYTCSHVEEQKQQQQNEVFLFHKPAISNIMSWKSRKVGEENSNRSSFNYSIEIKASYLFNINTFCFLI